MQILGLGKVRIMRFSGRKERNGGAARSANLGGCKGRAANGGEGKSGRFNRPEKEERSEARGQGEGNRAKDEGQRKERTILSS